MCTLFVGEQILGELVDGCIENEKERVTLVQVVTFHKNDPDKNLMVQSTKPDPHEIPRNDWNVWATEYKSCPRDGQLNHNARETHRLRSTLGH